MPTSDWMRRPGLVPLAVLTLVFIAFFFRAAPLTLDPVRTTNAPNQFDANRAIERLTRIIGDGKPHPVDSDALDAARERLVGEIGAMGYQPVVKDDIACRSSISGSSTRCARVRNILFEAGPRSGKAIVLTAHYDSVDDSPGAGDDGVGVAVWLEVAQFMAKFPPPKRVLFLLTDGEETALLGAQAFADNKSYGYDVDRIINLEARGVRGPAMMFETSHPNASVVTDWAKYAERPVSNSLMTAVYELLPNSTDLTVHLQSGLAGINMAIADGFNFYHTARDDLSMLDHASVQHMGDQALGAAQAFISSTGEPRGDIVYADVMTQTFVSLPLEAGLATLGLCFGAAILLVMKPARDADWRKLDWRSLVLPPALLLASGAFAWLAQTVLDLLRTEPEFWNAQPQAFNCVIFLGAMLLAVLGLTYLAPNSRREALFAGGWAWFLMIGVAGAFIVPGSAAIFLIPGVWFVLSAIGARIWPKRAIIFHGVAAFVMFIVFLPLIQLFDVMMGMSIAPLFGVLGAFLMWAALPLVGSIGRAARMIPAGAVATGLVICFAWAFFAPAYSHDRPLALDIAAHYDIDSREAVVASTSEPEAVPKAMLAKLNKTPGNVLPGFAGPFAYADLPYADRPSANLSVVSDTSVSGARKLELRIDAPGARFVRVRIPQTAHPVGLSYAAGRETALTKAQAGQFVFDCFGRSCDGGLVTVTLDIKAPADAKPVPWLVQGYWSGLPPAAEAIAALRPDSAVQIGTGDITITTRRFMP